MKLGHKSHLNTRNIFPKEVFSPRLEVDDEAHPSTQIHERNQ
jgi:hypothetical protein